MFLKFWALIFATVIIFIAITFKNHSESEKLSQSVEIEKTEQLEVQYGFEQPSACKNVLPQFMSACKNARATDCRDLGNKLININSNSTIRWIPLLPVISKQLMNLRFEHSFYAVKLLEDFISILPQYVDEQLLMNLFFLLLELGRLQDCRKYIDMSLALSKPSSSVYLNALILSYLEGDTDLSLLPQARMNPDFLAYCRIFPCIEANKLSTPILYDKKFEESIQIVTSKLVDLEFSSTPMIVNIEDIHPFTSWDRLSKYIDTTSWVYTMTSTNSKEEMGYFFSRRLRRYHDFITELNQISPSCNDVRHYMATQGMKYSIFQPPLQPFSTSFFPNLITVNLWHGKAPSQGQCSDSSSSQTSRLHHDDYDGFLFVLKGEKRIVLIPPDEVDEVVPAGNVLSVQENGRIQYASHTHSAHFTVKSAVQLAKGTKKHVVHLKKNQGLYIPRGWFHEVTSFGENIAINFWFRSPLNQ